VAEGLQGRLSFMHPPLRRGDSPVAQRVVGPAEAGIDESFIFYIQLPIKWLFANK